MPKPKKGMVFDKSAKSAAKKDPKKVKPDPKKVSKFKPPKGY
jgi:hypothetical protein